MVASRRRPAATALALGGVHALVDAASGFVLFRYVDAKDLDLTIVAGLILLYNLTAFGGQVPVALLVDRLGSCRAAALGGLALEILALGVAPLSPLLAALIVGLGNAAYHVGAGAHVLAISATRATESGLFVGPGAIGLFVGIWLGRHGPSRRLAFALLLVATLLPVAILLRRVASRRLPSPIWTVTGERIALVCFSLVLVSVAMRSLIGGALADAWRVGPLWVAAGLAATACAGKMLGGFIADRVGWLTAACAALIASAPLVGLGAVIPACALAGMLLFQMTMPLTLKAVHLLIPDRPALAFALPSAAILVGTLPGALGAALSPTWPLMSASVLLAAGVIGAALALLPRLGLSTGHAVSARQQRG